MTTIADLDLASIGGGGNASACLRDVALVAGGQAALFNGSARWLKIPERRLVTEVGALEGAYNAFVLSRNCEPVRAQARSLIGAKTR